MSKLSGAHDFGGSASLQNALDMAVNALKSVPPYGHREVTHRMDCVSSCSCCSPSPPMFVLFKGKATLHLPGGIAVCATDCRCCFLFAGLSSCDPGGIWDSIKQAKQQRCRVSVVGLAAEVFICREITKVGCQ